jgi:hypothetical protein
VLYLLFFNRNSSKIQQKNKRYNTIGTVLKYNRKTKRYNTIGTALKYNRKTKDTTQ